MVITALTFKCQSPCDGCHGLWCVSVCSLDINHVGRLRMGCYGGPLTSGQNLFKDRWCLADAFRPFSRGLKVKHVLPVSFLSFPQLRWRAAGLQILSLSDAVVSILSKRTGNRSMIGTTSESFNLWGVEKNQCNIISYFLNCAEDALSHLGTLQINAWCVYNTNCPGEKNVWALSVLSAEQIWISNQPAWLTFPRDIIVSEVHPEQRKIDIKSWQACFYHRFLHHQSNPSLSLLTVDSLAEDLIDEV